MENTNSMLIAALIGAIEDETKWKQVLRVILDMTGAKAAIITLRENTTCQIVDDVQLQKEHHSPFVEGFTLEKVAYYIYNLRQQDAWANAQITHRPLVPTQMSRLVSSEEFEKTELGQWCAEQGINDTIAVQIGQVPGFWTALNVFYDADPQSTARIFAVLNDHLPLLKNAWRTGREVVRNRQTGEALLAFLSDRGTAACLLDLSGAVTEANRAFWELKRKGLVRVATPSKRISLADSVDRNGMEPRVSAQLGSHQHDGDAQSFRAGILPIATDPLFAGGKKPETLLVIEKNEHGGQHLRRELDTRLNTLTPKEAALFEAVASGLPVHRASETIGVKRSQTFAIWGRVKEKLGLESASQLRAIRKP